MTAYRYAVIGCKLKRNADEGCYSCATVVQLLQDFVLCFIVRFIACFILLVIAPLHRGGTQTVGRFAPDDRGVVTVSRRSRSIGLLRSAVWRQTYKQYGRAPVQIDVQAAWLLYGRVSASVTIDDDLLIKLSLYSD